MRAQGILSHPYLTHVFCFIPHMRAYKDSECTGYTPEKKEIVAAKFAFDGNWYRARVDAIDLDGNIRLTYVDYGNSDELQVSEIRKLKPEFASLPLQVMKDGLH